MHGKGIVKRIGAVFVCFLLVSELVFTSYTRTQAAATVATFGTVEIVGSLLASLGITAATGVALDKSGLTLSDAEKILDSIYTSAQNFSHETDEAINDTIMAAIGAAASTGKIIFKEGSEAWDALKAWAKGACEDIKNLVALNEAEALEEYCAIRNDYVHPYQDFYDYCEIVGDEMLANVGESWGELDFTYSNTKYFYNPSVTRDSYGLMFLCHLKNANTDEYRLYGSCVYSSYASMIANYKEIVSGMNKEDGYLHFNYSVWTFGQNGASTSYNTNLWGKLVDVHILSSFEMDILNKYGTSDLAMSNIYDTVYNPAIEGTTDIVTPSRMITREENGSVVVSGDTVIDVASPVAYPVDLTKGIVIGLDIPIEEAIEKTIDEPTEDKEKKDPESVTPDTPVVVGDDLTADLKSIFPFCIPFDLITCIKGLSADAVAPRWVIQIPMPTGYVWEIVVDMADFDNVIKVFRIGEDLLFIVGLIMITRSLMIRG